ncbi:M48 family metallopeptidase [Ectothiorhodospiraceae bacterium WFHF3C12]|nr:M48 family metallopeptidase [Ectothiorhodospiraceae bacterium WFHF3C12]
MNSMWKSLRVPGIAIALFAMVAGCTTSPTGRQQLQLFPEKQMAQMGSEAYENIKKETPVSEDPAVNGYVSCVADAIIRVLPEGREVPPSWEVTVFRSDQVNAFALPGGKIGVYTGLLRVAENQHQLAAIVGHEIGHVLANHSNARLSANYATMAGLTVISVLAGASGAVDDQRTMMALLGLGAQVGVLLPFSRSHESEADEIGLELMAEAGFSPAESVELWKRMAEASDGQPPEFLSTHPSHGTRIRDLQDQVPRAQRLYDASPYRPDCREVIPEAVNAEDAG